MATDNEARFVVLVTAALLIFGVMVGFFNGVVSGRQDVRQEAIKTGVARWVSDENGASKFEWVIRGEDR